MPKISALPNNPTPDGADELPVNDVSATTTKKMTLTVFKEWLQSVANFVTTSMITALAVTASKIDFTTFSGTTTQWRSWTPTLTNFTGTVNVARYTLVGKTCHFYIKVTQGASVTGQHTFSLPVEVSANNAVLSPINPVGTKGYILDSGTAQFPAEAQLINSTSMGLLCFNAVGTYLSPSASSPIVPMVWSAGNDNFIIQGYYETV